MDDREKVTKKVEIIKSYEVWIRIQGENKPIHAIDYKEVHDTMPKISSSISALTYAGYCIYSCDSEEKAMSCIRDWGRKQILLDHSVRDVDFEIRTSVCIIPT